MTRISPTAESTPVAAGATPQAVVSPSAAPVQLATRASQPSGPVSRSPRSAWKESEPQKAGGPGPAAEHLLHQVPPWLVSAVVHMVLLIGLGLWFFATGGDGGLTLDLRYDEKLGMQLDEEAIEQLADELSPEDFVLTPDNLRPVEDPLAAPQLLAAASLPTATTGPLLPVPLGHALSGREFGSKESLLAAYGGDATTEAAVMEALKWLAKNQQPSGMWSLAGPYQDGANVENPKAATAMALLAFQGAGYTHQGSPAEPFTQIVARGWSALLKEQADDGSFLGEYYHHVLYTHAQCTIALCELYAMTRDESLRQPAERAVAYCLKAQSPTGGWRYSPGQGGDLSVTGWFVMALKSAQMAGLEVPSDAFARVDAFLETVSHQDGARYSYLPKENAKRSMTAEGLLCRQYLGWPRSDARLIDGVGHLLANPVKWSDRDVYYWYYATQVCHHMEGDFWTQWNAEMKRVLPGEQIKSGRERGSWDPEGDPYGFQAGRLYVTCLSTYMLEVYYRHLPLYRQEFVK
jgi:hypothetical protein